MSKHIAFLSAAAAVLGVAVLPAAAADYYGGDEGAGDRPLAYHSRDDVFIDEGGARIERRQDIRPAGRRAPGPVVFDERGPDRPFDGPGYGGPVYRRPAAVGGFGDDRPPGFIPRAGRPYEVEAFAGYGGGYRPAAVAVGGGFGIPEEGCTIERGRSITAAGWEKTVTRRTCYRR